MPQEDSGTECSADAEDRRLIERAAGGDRSALADLYRAYQPRLFRFVLRITRSYPVAEELVNDIMLDVWRQAGQFRGDSKLSTWILSIAYRKACRASAKKTLAIAADIEPEKLPDTSMSGLETEDWVSKCLDVLPAAQKLTVIMVFYLGLSYEEIARVSDCPVNTVKTRMFHARRKLKERMTYAARHDALEKVREG